MSEQIISILRNKLENFSKYGETNRETKRNALKEELQFYVLDFIYHNTEYSRWTMYGGSALRIMHELNRMSVDLDFEVSHRVDDDFLNNLTTEILNHFKTKFGAGESFLSVTKNSGRGLVLKFNVGKELDLGLGSDYVHVKIDLNNFFAPKTVVERRTVNHDQLSFVVLTYNMSSLMASKLAAIFLRGTRGVGEVKYDEKGRDIYDLLWYMEKKIIPDLDYLKAKNIDVKDIKDLFNKITIKILNNPGTDENLKNDLLPLFENQGFIQNWLKNWRNTYLRLLENYKITTVTTLNSIDIFEHFSTDNFSFTFIYNTEDGNLFKIRYLLSDYWIYFNEGILSLDHDQSLDRLIKVSSDGWSSRKPSLDILNKYVTLFSRKNNRYLKKMRNVVFGDGVITKVIRMTAENLNPNQEILLNKSALVSCELDDLFK